MTTTSNTAAKYPRSVIAGPYGHPFHPALVTLPIGAWVTSVVLDIVSLATDNSALAEASRWVIGIGIVGALIAAVFGLLDLSRIPRDTRAFRTGAIHAVLNVIAVVLFAASLWSRTGDEDSVPTVGLVLSLIGLAVIGASGWLGGELAYRYGVRVADEETQAHGYR
ncbi:MAG: DUF2231 domain-containing protein [Actinomycetes bacterium]